jgi:4-hydroxy-tetrahydrodipicolinate reductase
VNYALIGYGKMGREIEQQAAQRGHRLCRVVDPLARGRRARRRLDPDALAGADVAFEFSVPAEAERNVRTALEAGCPVVCGTTAWQAGPELRRAARRTGAGAVIAPNFSVGMNLFYEIVREAAGRLGRAGLHDPYIVEWHHRGKLDAPSGTARALARVVTEADPRRERIVEGHPDGALPADALQVVGVRAGHEPGTHVVGFDGPHDGIRLEHRARGRSAFALGAVLAGEWVLGRRGIHGFDRVLADLLKGRLSIDTGPAKETSK